MVLVKGGPRTVILAMDVSLSMQATDVAPSRFDAAKAAATRFVDEIPSHVQVGLVRFSGTAVVWVQPTGDRRQVKEGISNLKLGPATAIGEAVFTSLSSLASLANPGPAPPAGIVLLTDGETTVGRPNAAAADAASAASVSVSTIALGTPQGVVTVEGSPVPVPVNREATRALAQSTQGHYYEASSAEELDRSYDALRSLLFYREVGRGLSAADLAIGALLGAAVGAATWFVLRSTRAHSARQEPSQLDALPPAR